MLAPVALVLLGWWLLTSGDLVDSRGAEKGVSRTRFTRTLRLPTLYVNLQDHIYGFLEAEGINVRLPATMQQQLFHEVHFPLSNQSTDLLLR